MEWPLSEKDRLDSGAAFLAERQGRFLPTTIGENLDAGWDRTWQIETSEARRVMMGRAWDDYLGEVERVTGKRLPNPWHRPSRYDPSLFYYPGDDIKDADEVRSRREREVASAIGKLKEQHPELALKSPEQIFEDVKARVRGTAARAAEVQAGASTIGDIGYYLGAAAAGSIDPPNLAALLATPGGSIWRQVAANAGIGFGVEALNQWTSVQDWKKAVGLRHGWADALESAVGAGAAAGALTGLIGGAARAVKFGFALFGPGSEGRAAAIAADAVKDHAAANPLRPPPEAAPAERPTGAEPGAPPFRVGDTVQWTSGGADMFAKPQRLVRIETGPDGKHYGFVEGSATGLPMDELRAWTRSSPAEAEAAHDTAAVAADRIVRGESADAAADLARATEATKDFAASTPDLQRLSVERIEADPARFQFRDRADAAGVSDRLAGVKTWDPILGGDAVLVWQDKGGKLWIVDGHHRLELAKRLMREGHASIDLNATILHERQGYTAEHSMLVGAIKNISGDRATPVEAAKVLRLIDRNPTLASYAREGRLPPIPPNSALYRQARPLAKLGDEAFALVINEVVPPNYAAWVGRLMAAATDGEQVAALKALARAKPENELQARVIVEDVRQSGFAQAEQTDMFGTVLTVESLAPLRAKVLDAALKELRKDKAVFQRLVAEARRVGEAGNVLDTAANQKRALSDAETLQLVATLATRAGPISDALSEAARALDAGGKLAEVAGRFLEAVRGRRGVGADAGPAPRSEGSGAEGGRTAETGLSEPDWRRFEPKIETLVVRARAEAASRKNRRRPYFETLDPVSGPDAAKMNAILAERGADVRNVEGFRFVVGEDEIRHTLNQHGDAAKEARLGQLPIEEADFARLPEIFFDHPDIVPPHRLGANRDKANIVQFEKTIDNAYRVAVEVLPGRGGRLVFKSMTKRPVRDGEGKGPGPDATADAKRFPGPGSRTDAAPQGARPGDAENIGAGAPVNKDPGTLDLWEVPEPTPREVANGVRAAAEREAQGNAPTGGPSAAFTEARRTVELEGDFAVNVETMGADGKPEIRATTARTLLDEAERKKQAAETFRTCVVGLKPAAGEK